MIPLYDSFIIGLSSIIHVDIFHGKDDSWSKNYNAMIPKIFQTNWSNIISI